MSLSETCTESYNVWLSHWNMPLNQSLHATQHLARNGGSFYNLSYRNGFRHSSEYTSLFPTAMLLFVTKITLGRFKRSFNNDQLERCNNLSERSRTLGEKLQSRSSRWTSRKHVKTEGLCIFSFHCTVAFLWLVGSLCYISE